MVNVRHISPCRMAGKILRQRQGWYWVRYLGQLREVVVYDNGFDCERPIFYGSKGVLINTARMPTEATDSRLLRGREWVGYWVGVVAGRKFRRYRIGVFYTARQVDPMVELPTTFNILPAQQRF